MRVSALIPAVLAVVLAISLLPAAAASDAAPGGDAVPGDGGAAPGSSSPPVTARLAGDAQSWSPGDLDIDWAAFAEEHRASYEASSWAHAAADGQAAREALRAEAAQMYAESTGADLPARYADLDPARASALAHQYYDECDDGSNLPDNGVQASREGLYRGGADAVGGVTYNPVDGNSAPPPQVDIRSVFLLQSTDSNGRFDQTAFLMYTCREWAFENLGAGGITFGLYTNFEGGESQYPTVLGDPESGPDFIVSIFPELNVPERPYQIMAIRTPTRDRATWTITFLDVANRLDGFQIDGVVPTSAIGDFTAASGFAWTVETVDTQQPAGGRDWFPERNWLLRTGEDEDEEVGTHIPQFPVPETCGLQRETTGHYTLIPQQVTPDDDGYRFQWYHPTIRSPQAWETIRDSATGGRTRPVTVAVIDTGIDATRFDFLDGGARVVGGLDAVYGLELEGGNNAGAIGPFIGPSNVPYTSFGAAPPPRNSDRDPHGTAVSSLIGARGNNTFGIAGMDWGVRLMPVRVNDVNGCITSVVVAEGIKWAVDHGADVIHISLAATEPPAVPDPDRPGIEGVPECSDGLDNDGDGRIDHVDSPNRPPGVPPDPKCDSPDDPLEGDVGSAFDPLREVIDYALEKGVPVVAAAGNFGSLDDPVIYPAAYPGVIAVGATTRANQRAGYSSTGRWLHISAPGGDNSGTLAGDLAVLWELGRIRSAAGTSFSAPLVSGGIALYLGLNPHIIRGFTPFPVPPDPAVNIPNVGYTRTVDDVRIAVQNGSRDISPSGHDIFTGWGVFDVDRMLDVDALGGPVVDPARVQLPRTNADSVIEAAETIALSRPEVLPPFVVFTRNDVAVDALAASPLLADGPLLVSYRDRVHPTTMATLNELMPGGGQVYLLGGEQALSAEVEQQLADAGHSITRLAGATRFETALRIAEEVRERWPGNDTVGIARADGGDNPTAQWADALSGGAWAAHTRTPMLVTGTTALHPDVAEALQRWGTTSTVVFGGEQAVSSGVEAALPAPTRIAGESRDATAVAVAEQLWDDADGYLIANGYFARGWAPALAAAGLAADLGHPLLYTGAEGIPPATAALLAATCPGEDSVQIIGGASLVTGTAESALLEAVTC